MQHKQEECYKIQISSLSPPPFRILNHTSIDLLMAGEGSETTILLAQHTVYLLSFYSISRLLILIGLFYLTVFVNKRRILMKRVLIHIGFKYHQQNVLS